MDYLPTLCSLVGIEIDPAEFEGENMADVWTGSERQRGTPLFWRTSSGNANPSMLNGNWKLHRRGGSYLLYDLSTDEKELNDVAQKYPKVLEYMTNQMEEWAATLPTSYMK
jgi:arylsulfatase A-like enzyme